MSQEWYYSVNGDRQGPITAAELKKLAEAGTLKGTDLVWKDGMADWAQAKTIKGLFGGGGSGSAAPSTGKASEQPARARPRDDEGDDRPRRRPRDDDEDEDDRPRRRPRDDVDADDRPVRSRRRDDDEDKGDDRPRRKSRDDDEDEDDDRPVRRKKSRVPEDIPNKKMVAGLLAILIGSLGIHKFYLGFTTAGIIMILLACVGVSWIIGIIEGIIYLTKSDEDFYRDYVVNEKQWF
ncbi:MAG TPA: GYF domain-containing protein [Gemmataceae bacterium]|nr:GYF domain-containing protein [Gemmataceae bacterium]